MRRSGTTRGDPRTPPRRAPAPRSCPNGFRAAVPGCGRSSFGGPLGRRRRPVLVLCAGVPGPRDLATRRRRPEPLAPCRSSRPSDRRPSSLKTPVALVAPRRSCHSLLPDRRPDGFPGFPGSAGRPPFLPGLRIGLADRAGEPPPAPRMLEDRGCRPFHHSPADARFPNGEALFPGAPVCPGSAERWHRI